jgi:hypothetical protein
MLNPAEVEASAQKKLVELDSLLMKLVEWD